MRAGIASLGESVQMLPSSAHKEPKSEVAVFYGFNPEAKQIFREYRSVGKTAVCVDLGYWGRRKSGPLSGYHKISVNDRHPTAYFQNREHDGKRLDELGVKIKPWSDGEYILLAGMSAKAAEACGFAPQEWEQKAVEEIRKHTDREIIYRPKPSWYEAEPIKGTIYEPGPDDLSALLMCAHAVVTHHSNVAVDGLIEGVPAFTFEGVATALGLSDLSQIESPRRDGDREQWARDISYCQFSMEEMRRGVAWAHLKSESLVP